MTNAISYETIDLAMLKQYETFDTVAEMDVKIYEYIEVLRNDEQPESVIEVLRFLGRSSLRITGVSFAKYQTIADSIGISKRTVIRAMNKLADFGMIERIPTVKKWIGKSRKKSVNIIVIQAECSEVLSTMSRKDDTTAEAEQVMQDKAETVESEKEPSSHNHTSNLRTRDGEEAGKRALKTSIPRAIYSVLEPFFGAKDLYEVYGILLRAKASIDRRITLEDNAESYTDEFFNVIRKYKLGEVRNFKGLLYSAWQKVTSVVSRQIADRNASSGNRAKLFAEVMSV